MSRRTLVTLGLLLLICLTQLAFAPPAQEAEAQSPGPTPAFWVILFIMMVILVLLLVWALRGSPRSMVTLEDAHATHHETAEEEHVDEAAAEPAETVQAKASETAAEPAEAKPAKTVEAEAEPAEVVEEVSESAEPAAPAEQAPTEQGPDDLRIIEGIGPKLSQALNGIGITTFAQLATQDPETLEAQLKEAGARFIKGQAQTWPAQAELAAAQKWDELEKLQNEFKGGRRAD